MMTKKDIVNVNILHNGRIPFLGGYGPINTPYPMERSTVEQLRRLIGDDKVVVLGEEPEQAPLEPAVDLDPPTGVDPEENDETPDSGEEQSEPVAPVEEDEVVETEGLEEDSEDEESTQQDPADEEVADEEEDSEEDAEEESTEEESAPVSRTARNKKKKK